MEATRQTHATYYLQFSEEAEPELHGPQQIVWLEESVKLFREIGYRWFLARALTFLGKAEVPLSVPAGPVSTPRALHHLF